MPTIEGAPASPDAYEGLSRFSGQEVTGLKISGTLPDETVGGAEKHELDIDKIRMDIEDALIQGDSASFRADAPSGPQSTHPTPSRPNPNGPPQSTPQPAKPNEPQPTRPPATGSSHANFFLQKEDEGTGNGDEPDKPPRPGPSRPKRPFFPPQRPKPKREGNGEDED